jgi:aspartate aminotransferase
MKPKLAKRMVKLDREGAFAVLAHAEMLEREGKKVIHFEIGQPDFPTPKNITNAGIEALKKGRTRYTPSVGTHELRVALSDYVTRTRGRETAITQVAVTPSAKTALFTALASVVEPGDEVMYPDPGFPAYKILIEFFGGKAVPVPMVEARHFSFDMAIFRKKLSKKTRAVILNSPSNPTGTIIPSEDLEEIGQLVKKTGIWIISDEIYHRILYTGKPFMSIYSFPELMDQVIIVDGFSKTYAMTGWRLGYMVFPERIMQRIDYLLTHAVACTATFVQDAGVEAISGPQNSVDAMVREFKRRRDFVINTLNNMDGVTCAIPDGAFYAFPNIKSFGKTSKAIADYLLTEAGVALLDGTSFGKYGEGYLRISYATSMGQLEEGLSRMKKALEKLP